MFDGFWSGMFGGLLGPALAHWLSRFKYWVVFLAAVAGTYIEIFILGIHAKGWKYAINVGLKRAFEIDTLLAVVSIGLLAIFVAFIGTLSNRKRLEDADPGDKK